ncbi:OmpA family protein [Dysgonomonas sp. 520]|uniref:OmpA family protein n=1 Tax=Dysgonomonas sp. 520 TaxID=2302931 RepID=UPI0013D3980C|nr:OmpA family protein [Dysgonomonas sp. 520]NDW10530.1 OmpA family protein [Dysgonomonas sp. 520]
MNKKFLLITLFTLFSALAIQAQTYNPDAESDKGENTKKTYNAYKTTWQKNKFKDNWFISLGAGLQTIMAEDDDKASFGSRLTLAPALTIGKYFSPIWGLRLNFTGGSLHGFNDGWAGTYRKWNSGSKHYMGKGYAGTTYGDGFKYPAAEGGAFHSWDPQWEYLGFGLSDGGRQVEYDKEIVGIDHAGSIEEYVWNPGKDKGALYMQHVRYFATNLNFMFDFLTLCGDYNPKRVFEMTPFLGVSYFHTFAHLGQDSHDGFGVNGGLQMKVRVAKKLSIFFEGNLTAYPEDFDGHMGDNMRVDLVGQGVAGLTVDLGKNTWEVCEPTNYGLIKDMNAQINYWRDQYEELKNTPVECPECPVVEPEPKKEEELCFLPDPVFFRIDKSVIDATEWSKIEKAAVYLKSNPTTNVVVTGYADKKTAYPAYNLKLSERRSKTVANALVEKYGIDRRRVSINWEGDQIQPFSINEWNRVVIFVLE